MLELFHVEHFDETPRYADYPKIWNMGPKPGGGGADHAIAEDLYPTDCRESGNGRLPGQRIKERNFASG